MIPLTVIVIGPLGVYGGELIANVVNWLMHHGRDADGTGGGELDAVGGAQVRGEGGVGGPDAGDDLVEGVGSLRDQVTAGSAVTRVSKAASIVASKERLSGPMGKTPEASPTLRTWRPVSRQWT